MNSRKDSLMAAGLVWTHEHEFTTVASNAVVQVGFVTGASNFQFERRTYTASESKMRVSLYEVAFTGGTNIMRTYNRNQSGSPTSPVQMKAGVTFTPNTAIASLLLRGDATGTKATTTIPEDEPLILKKNTSYVLTFQNLAGQDADIDFRINAREQGPSELVR